MGLASLRRALTNNSPPLASCDCSREGLEGRVAMPSRHLAWPGLLSRRWRGGPARRPARAGVRSSACRSRPLPYPLPPPPPPPFPSPPPPHPPPRAPRTDTNSHET
eukprot:7931292-Pyramimonas_sp.AAC.2